MTAPAATPAAAPTGAIHDLGYKRYLGTRRPQSTRWRVIVRDQVATAWKTWWRFKMALGLAVIATVTGGGFLYAARFVLDLTHGGGRLRGLVGDPLDGMLVIVVPWLCRVGFLVGLTVASGTIAADAQVGAFTFYFSRPVRPIDYVIGKMGGIFLLQLIVIAAPLVLLTGFRLGLARDSDELIARLPQLAAAVATGLCGALVFTAIPVGLSSLASRRGKAIALWAVWYVLIGSVFQAIAIATDATALGAIDPLTAIDSIAQHLFGASFMHGLRPTIAPLGWALAMTALASVGGFALAWWQVSERAHAGVGSG